MSDMKHGALVESGIEVGERVPIPDELIPQDARVEMDAKKAAGYFYTDPVPADELTQPKGRGLDE
jgi:GTP cyclohydrolase II